MNHEQSKRSKKRRAQKANEDIKRKTTGKTRKEKKQVDFSSEDVLCVISKNVSILNVIENLV